MRVANPRRRRALAAHVLALTVVLGVLGCWAITSESRHPAPAVPPATQPDRFESSLPPTQAEIRPVEEALSDAFTR